MRKINSGSYIAKDNSGYTACLLDIVQPNTSSQCVFPTILIEGYIRYDSEGNCYYCKASYEFKSNGYVYT